MLKRQERAVQKAVDLRVLQASLPDRIDAAVYQAVREQGVPIPTMVAELGVCRQRIYQMIGNGERVLFDL